MLRLDDPDITINLAYVISDMTLEQETMAYLANQSVIAMVMEWAMSSDESMHLNAAITLVHPCSPLLSHRRY